MVFGDLFCFFDDDRICFVFNIMLESWLLVFKVFYFVFEDVFLEIVINFVKSIIFEMKFN